MPKKQPRNAFYFFMLDYKARCERNGERFPNGLKDVQDPAGSEWKVLPPSMRKKYEDMAKAEKIKVKADDSRKETCNHNSFTYIDRQKQEEEDAKKNMYSWIETTIRSISLPKYLAEYKFYLIHANYLCVSQGEVYHVVELAVAEFSLGEGITNTYHTFIDPGPLPLGYLHEAQQKSDQTHKIPVNNDRAEKNINKIFSEIKKILAPGRRENGGDWPPMFTMPDNVASNTSISCVKNLMQNLCDNASEDETRFPIYNLIKLFYELKNSSHSLSTTQNGKQDFPNMSLAQVQLEQDPHSYVSHIACDFHQDEDRVEFCSLSYVQRWVYLICDFCCELLNIPVIPGRHCPKDTDVNFLQQSKRLELQREQQEPGWSKPKKTSHWNPVDPLPLPQPSNQWSVMQKRSARMNDPQGNQRKQEPPFSSSGDYSPSSSSAWKPVPQRDEDNQFGVSEENFPTMGRGRSSRGAYSSAGPGIGRSNYASAMKRF